MFLCFLEFVLLIVHDPNISYDAMMNIGGSTACLSPSPINLLLKLTPFRGLHVLKLQHIMDSAQGFIQLFRLLVMLFNCLICLSMLAIFVVCFFCAVEFPSRLFNAPRCYFNALPIISIGFDANMVS